ncbi:MAG: diphthamide biosynthesis enzyme Dph2 [Candidatus Bathyarchaeia archaeon]
MRGPSYDLEIERVSEKIRRRRARRILLQLPDGLRPQAFKLAAALRERTGAEVILLGDSCYGACDIALSQAEALGADLLVHYGHSRMLPDAEIPVLYVEAKVEVDIETLVEEALPLIEGWRTVGLTATAQHVHQLGAAAEALRRRGMRAVIGPAGGRTAHSGQVLGCDYGTARAVADRVDGFLFIGGGRFHPLGLVMATGRPVVAADPYLASATAIGEGELKQLAMRRMAAIAAARAAQRLGVLLSLKPGQFDPSLAEALREKLERHGFEATIICLDEVRAEALSNFAEAEAFINTACPRVAMDGVAGLRRPILTVEEAQVMLGERRWEDLWGGSHPPNR